MKLFKCQACGQVLLFENTRCEKCARRLGYLPQANLLTVVEPSGEDWAPYGGAGGRYRYCRNADYDCCNWLVPADSLESLCVACRHNGTVPDLSQQRNVALWRKIELAKHRLFYSLLRLELPLQTRAENSEGLVFEFLDDDQNHASGPKVLTGHDDGLITIALAEADDAERESRRSKMGEPYRTLLGHFRHEIGHYYWDRLIRDTDLLEPCRAVFGDDRRDYGEALKAHYENGAPAFWQESFVSAYATSHPWEDFAETWAHYFHIVDTLEMARAFGVDIHPRLDIGEELETHIDFQPYRARSVSQLVDAWLPLTFALNSINRSMGQPDLYPFILTPAIVEKLGFIHRICGASAHAPINKGQRPDRAQGGTHSSPPEPAMS
jgi:hypothetical protein